ncbi:MAG: hypothetical protein M1830_000234 [Pleopsidium flavum]|nr:MAG: hypothetical protein M1830_000234 [Pleopsidium flavum]
MALRNGWNQGGSALDFRYTEDEGGNLYLEAYWQDSDIPYRKQSARGPFSHGLFPFGVGKADGEKRCSELFALRHEDKMFMGVSPALGDRRASEGGDHARRYSETREVKASRENSARASLSGRELQTRSDLRLEPRQGIPKTPFWPTGMETIQFLCPRISSSTLMMDGAA